MGIVFTDRAKETTTSTGLYNLNLDGAAAGFVALPDTGNFYYCIQNEDGSEWEVGIGSCTGTVFSRGVTPLSSSTGSKVDFSAGTKYVFCVAPAAHHAELQGLLNANVGKGRGIATGTTVDDDVDTPTVVWSIPFDDACGVLFLSANYVAIAKEHSGSPIIKVMEGTVTIVDNVASFTKTVTVNQGSTAHDITSVDFTSGDLIFTLAGEAASGEWSWTIGVEVNLSQGSGC